jgi:hypothetical protein
MLVLTTQLREEHFLPMAMMGRCSSCYPYLHKLQKEGLIPADKNLCTIFVNRSSSFGYRCINARCPDKYDFQTFRCMLQHRNFQDARMNISLKDEVWLDVDTQQLDLDHPEMIKNHIEMNYGPLQDCNGFLDWDGTRDVDDGADWLKCNVCDAKYRTYILSYYNSLSNEYSYIQREYELILPQTAYRPMKIHRRSFSEPLKNSADVPMDWFMWISEIRFKGLNFSFIPRRVD